MLKKRIITAAVLIPLIITAIFLFDRIGFLALLTAFIAVGAWEWARLCKLNKNGRYVYSAWVIVILSGLFLWQDMSLYYLTLAGVANSLVVVVLILAYQQRHNLIGDSQYILLVLGMLLLLPMSLGLAALQADDPNLVLFLIVLISSADTAAYFVGRKWGKRKLASLVSPNKTWEGVFGGVSGGGIAALCYMAIEKFSYGWAFFMLSVLAVLASIFGDLVVSMAKREADIKDSGVLFPGHGGVMDRFDGLTLAVPVFVFGLMQLEIIT